MNRLNLLGLLSFLIFFCVSCKEDTSSEPENLFDISIELVDNELFIYANEPIYLDSVYEKMYWPGDSNNEWSVRYFVSYFDAYEKFYPFVYTTYISETYYWVNTEFDYDFRFYGKKARTFEKFYIEKEYRTQKD